MPRRATKTLAPTRRAPPRSAPAARAPPRRRSGRGWRTRGRAPPTLFDHFVGARQQRHRRVEAERLGGLEVDHQLILVRLLHRQVAWFLTPENAVDVGCRASPEIVNVDPIRGKTTFHD